ncbi:MAG: TetR/AcrR family transcriptional regulator [Mycobacterium sp.]
MPRTSRWAGLSQADRRAARRAMLVRAAYGLFAEGGEAAVTLRSVCRRSDLHARYFSESFSGTDALLGAVYDVVVADLTEALATAMAGLPDVRARLAAGIRTVLSFSSEDPGRGKILFIEARTNPVLAQRRTATQEELRKSVLPGAVRERTADLVGAAMYAGAMAELAQQWLLGQLGADLETVVDSAVGVIMPGRPRR